MPRFKIRVDSWIGEHVHLTVFGTERDQCTLANHGTLVMNPGEYSSFVCALSMGAERMGDVSVEVDETEFLRERDRRYPTSKEE